MRSSRIILAGLVGSVLALNYSLPSVYAGSINPVEPDFSRKFKDETLREVVLAQPGSFQGSEVAKVNGEIGERKQQVRERRLIEMAEFILNYDSCGYGGNFEGMTEEGFGYFCNPGANLSNIPCGCATSIELGDTTIRRYLPKYRPRFENSTERIGLEVSYRGDRVLVTDSNLQGSLNILRYLPGEETWEGELEAAFNGSLREQTERAEEIMSEDVPLFFRDAWDNFGVESKFFP